MKWFLLALFLLLFLILLICYLLRRRWAIKRVRCSSDEEKLSYIDAALNPFGFRFDLGQDIVVSKNDAWQRDLGYTDFYDLKAPFLNMVMHCEPIYFDYDCKHYRIEFWKGQYGITTGAEVGVYIRDDHSCLPKGFYRCANDEERLNISFNLFKVCSLFTRCDKSWWLTGFDVGTFSRPRDLQMKICIKFPNDEMKCAFVEGLVQVGYARDHIEIFDCAVCVEFCCPSNYHLNHKYKLVKCFVQVINYINCHIYMWYTRIFSRTIDKLTYLRFMFPWLYRLVIRMCIPRRKQKKCCKKRK